MTQSPKKQGSRSPDKKPRLTQKNDEECGSPGENDEFIDLDDDLIQDDDYGDYDEEDDATTTASPNSKKNKAKTSMKSEFQRQRSGSSENTSRYDP